MLDASHKRDLTPANETFPPPCINHPNRLGNMWRQSDGARVCADCWREDNIQAPITTDAELIERAEQDRALTPHEAYALRQRNRRKC